MKKIFKVIAFSLGGLFVAFLVAKYSGMFTYYTIATPSNEPTLKKNAIVFSSNLKQPKRFDFILYNYNSPEFGRSVWIHRLCGLPGDKIQLIQGELFINGINTELSSKTYHNYMISSGDLESLQKHITFSEDKLIQVSRDSFNITLDKATIKRYKLQVSNFFPPDINEEIYKVYQQHWTADNFGPLLIPANSYFVLGDNRSNTLDSRYIGLISKDNYVGTVLGTY